MTTDPATQRALSALTNLAATLTDQGIPPTAIRAACRDGIRYSHHRCRAVAPDLRGGHGVNTTCVKPGGHHDAHQTRYGYIFAQDRKPGWTISNVQPATEPDTTASASNAATAKAPAATPTVGPASTKPSPGTSSQPSNDGSDDAA